MKFILFIVLGPTLIIGLISLFCKLSESFRHTTFEANIHTSYDKVNTSLPVINSCAEQAYKRYSDSKAIDSLIYKLFTNIEQIEYFNIQSSYIKIGYKNKQQKTVYFRDMGLPDLSKKRDIFPSEIKEVGMYRSWDTSTFKKNISSYPYLTFCYIGDFDPDECEYNYPYFNECKVVGYLLAKKTKMHFNDDGYGFSSEFRQIFTPTKQW